MAEIQSAQPPAIPSWVMMDQHFRLKNPGSFRADDETSAETLDTNGKPVRVSFDLQSLPGSSRLCLHCPEERPPFGRELIVAAHDDAVLFRIEVDFDGLPVNRGCAMDYFIYRACSPSSGPKLTLLPRCYSTDAEVRESDGASWRRQWRMVNSSRIGIYATEEGSLVAELGIDTWSAKDKTAPLKAELFKLFSPSSLVSANGGGQWELKLARSRGNKVRFQEIDGWYTHKVVPYTSFLCWADYNQGVLICDVMDTNPDLQYAKLPVDDMPREEFPTFSRTVCVTKKYQTMKFVKVSNMPSCPNCKPGPSFTISVWTLNNKPHNEWEWVQDANITASDLWAMEGYHQDLPCSVPQFPLVSMDDPHILYFVVTGIPASRRPDLSEGTIWIVTLNIKSNTVLNSHDINGFPLDSNIFSGFGFFPSNFTSYLKKHSSEIKEHIKKTKDEKNAKKAEVNNVQKSQGKGAVQKGSKGLKLGGGGGKR